MAWLSDALLVMRGRVSGINGAARGATPIKKRAGRLHVDFGSIGKFKLVLSQRAPGESDLRLSLCLRVRSN